jgi:hypothetical protein
MLLSPFVKTEQPRCGDLQVHEPVSSRAFTEAQPSGSRHALLACYAGRQRHYQ